MTAALHTFTLLEELRMASGLSLGKLCRKARVTELAYLRLQRGENPARDRRVTRRVIAVLRQHDPLPRPGAEPQALRTATPAPPSSSFRVETRGSSSSAAPGLSSSIGCLPLRGSHSRMRQGASANSGEG